MRRDGAGRYLGARVADSGRLRRRPPAAVPAAPSPTRGRGRRRWAAALAAAAVASLLAIGVPRLFDDDTAASLLGYGPGMAIIDASTGEGTASISDSVVRRPAEAIFSGGHFWVLNLEPLSFVQIDPQSGRIVRQIASPTEDVGYFTVDGNDLWITEWFGRGLFKVDVQLGREVARFDDLPGDGGSWGVLVADGSLWVARRDADEGLGILARLDPDTFETEHVFHRLLGSLALAYGDDGAVWTGGSWGDVNRIDPQSNTVTSVNVGGRNNYVTAGSGFGWTADETKGVVYQIDNTGSIVASHPTAIGARAVSYSDGVVWVGNQDDGSVSAIDAATGEVTTYRFSHPIQAVAAGAGKVLVQLPPGQTFENAIGELDGDVAKLFVGSYALEPIDPALIWSDLGRQVAHATCAGLLRHTERDGLVPEVATGMPTVSDDGRTYTFTIRSGYRFSPPSNEAVSAETFRHSIERAVSPGLGADAPGPDLLDDIASLDADGDTLAITLTAPSDDFLERLAEPYFCPVPLGTPEIPGGVAVAIDGVPGDAMAPSAGPYFIARWTNGDLTVLRRNPNYVGPRPHRFDAIVLREGIHPDVAAALVASREWDGISNLFDRDGPVEEVFADRIGCLTPLHDGVGVDLAAMCLAEPA
jgi:Bacterial extracellular solute-binding proteins, family 5 Middle